MSSKVIYQGEIADVKRKGGVEQKVFVYHNSFDFPNYDILLLAMSGKYLTERIPINEEIWRKIGKSLGYKFITRKKKELE